MNFVNNSKCSYCLKKIQSKFIFCIQCNIGICVKCFCYGIEGGDHRKTHKYKIESVVKKDKVCLFKNDSKWDFDEELKLMDAVIVYKTGNWVDISSMVHTKTSEECRLHFIENYTKSSFGRSLIKYIKSNSNFSSLKPIFDHTDGEKSPVLYEKFPPSLLKSDEEKLLGFISNRNEFHLEFDDNAEQLIATLQPVNDINSLISALQTTLIDIYDHWLRKRYRYKRIAREHNLISHIIAHILEKSPRDFTYFHRQMLKRIYPSQNVFSFPTPTSTPRQKSIFGRVYMHQRHPSLKTQISNDSNSIDLSTPSEADNMCHTPIQILQTPLISPKIASFQTFEDHPSWHYNAFEIDKNLRPFLQFLTAETTKQFLDNLKKEEQLKSEILTLQSCVKHGILSYDDYKEKLCQHKKRIADNSNYAPDGNKFHKKRKRGITKNFNYIAIMRKKRLKKYLISLENHDN